jgi:hypothetical protein
MNPSGQTLLAAPSDSSTVSSAMSQDKLLQFLAFIRSFADHPDDQKAILDFFACLVLEEERKERVLLDVKGNAVAYLVPFARMLQLTETESQRQELRRATDKVSELRSGKTDVA